MTKNNRKLKEYFAKQKEISLAFLFGSQAKKRASQTSDFDIAIWAKESFSRDKRNRVWQEIETLLGKNVDLVLLNEARPTVAWAAMRGERLLIRDFGLYLRLFLRVSREAEDIQDFMLDFWKLKKRYADT